MMTLKTIALLLAIIAQQPGKPKPEPPAPFMAPFPFQFPTPQRPMYPDWFIWQQMKVGCEGRVADRDLPRCPSKT